MAFKRVFSMACPVLHCSLPSMARQEFQHDADMNVIVDRFLRTGVLDQPNAGRPCVDGLEMPGDFTEASNLAYEHQHQHEIEQNEQNEGKDQNEGKELNNDDGQGDSGDDQQDSTSGVERPVQ